MTHILPISLADGTFVAHFTDRGLARLDWPRRRIARSAPVPSERLPARIRLWLEQTRQALEQVLSGQSPSALPPLDLSSGTAFQREVWGRLRRIAPGRTRTYSQLAVAMGRPAAARAIGNACGANPVPLLVPCHRVVPASGGLGGFSGPPDWKRRLLESEKAAADRV